VIEVVENKNAQKMENLMKQIKQRLKIKTYLRYKFAMQHLLFECIIMLVWFSCIYK